MKRHRRALRRRYGRAGSPRVVSRGAMGGYQWSVRGNPRMRVQWNGPGSGLWLVMPSGGMTRIDWHGASGNYDTAHEASKAVKRFLDAK